MCPQSRAGPNAALLTVLQSGDMQSIESLEIDAIAVIAKYGRKTRFRDIEQAIRYVGKVSETVEDRSTPLEQIYIQIEYRDGSYERCGFRTRAQTLQWLEAFQERRKGK